MLIAIPQSKTGVHVNPGDLAKLVTAILTAGLYEKAGLVLPKLGLVANLPPGSLFFFSSVDMLHLNKEIDSGRRCVLNLSTDAGFKAFQDKAVAVARKEEDKRIVDKAKRKKRVADKAASKGQGKKQKV